MVKDYSEVPCDVNITNNTGKDVCIRINNIIDEIILAGDSLKVTTETSTQLALLETKIKELGLEEVRIPKLPVVHTNKTYKFKFKQTAGAYLSSLSNDEYDTLLELVASFDYAETSTSVGRLLSSYGYMKDTYEGSTLVSRVMWIYVSDHFKRHNPEYASMFQTNGWYYVDVLTMDTQLIDIEDIPQDSILVTRITIGTGVPEIVEYYDTNMMGRLFESVEEVK